MWNDEGDEDGLWWVTQPRVRNIKNAAQVVEARAKLIAALTWEVPPYVPPPLTAPPSGVIALDLETEDPDITDRGPSWAFPGRGSIIGVSVAWRDFEAYYPIGHREDNVERDNVYQWLRDTISRGDINIVCAHAAYDFGWLKRELGCYPKMSPGDVQFQAALLDENRLSYALDSISKSYLSEGKSYDLIDTVADRVYCKRSEVFQHLKELPGRIVAPYAVMDASLTYRLHQTLSPAMKEQDLETVYQLECDLITLSIEMRMRGIRVDVEGCQRLLEEYRSMMLVIEKDLHEKTGIHVGAWEGETCALALQSQGHVLPSTSTGRASVTKEILGSLAAVDPVAAMILRLRKLSKACTTFLEGHVLSYADEGRIHPTYNQLRREDSEQGVGMRGTISGRYSVDSPNVQQLPIRDREIGSAVRGIFLPEEGQQWCSLDYMSQEPRLLVDFAFRAELRGAAEAVKAYNDNPRLDMHQWVADLCGITRTHAKTVNLGRSYGMASAALARSLGLPTKWMAVLGRRWIDINLEDKLKYVAEGYSVVEVGGEETMVIIRKWEAHAPFIKDFINLAKKVADKRGYVKTLLQRRCRFVYNGNGYDWTYAAANRIIQGSAADQTKKAMLDMWREGIVPLLTLHDELGFSVDDESEGRRYGRYMEEAIPLSIPMVCDPKLAATWAGAK